MDYPSLFRNSKNRPWGSSPWSAAIDIPSIDMEDAGDHFLLSMDLPGLKKDDIHLELQNGLLRIWGERNQENEEREKGGYHVERFRGAFERSFQLSSEVKAEQIQAEYRDGVLRIAVPKTTASGARQIKIGDAKPGFFERLLGKRDEERRNITKAS